MHNIRRQVNSYKTYTDIVGSRTFSAQEVASLEIEASLSRLHIWNSYLESNGPLYIGSFQVCQYFDQCRGSIQLMSIPPRGNKSFVGHFS